MEYSPRLKRVMAEIRAIIDREDLAASVVIHEFGFSEFHLKLTPSYSIAKLENGNQLIFKASLKDFNGNKQLRDYKVAATANMLTIMAETLGTTALNIIQVSEAFDEKFKIEHGKGGFTSQLDLDN
jgi:hypothetical protein